MFNYWNPEGEYITIRSYDMGMQKSMWYNYIVDFRLLQHFVVFKKHRKAHVY